MDVDELRSQFRDPDRGDRVAWEQIRAELRRSVDDSTFEIWLACLDLRAIDQARVLLVVGPEATRAWVASRFGPLLSQTAHTVGRQVRLADDRERQLLDAITPTQPDDSARGPACSSSRHASHDHKEAV